MSGTRNSKRKKQANKKKPENVIKFKLSKERDERIEYENMKGKVAKIYEDWRHDMINKPKSPEQMPDAVNELRARLVKELPEASMKFVDEMLEPILARLHYAAIDIKNQVVVYADCPHTIQINAEKQSCGWGGKTGIPQHRWLSGMVDFKCPQCGGILTKADMADVSEVDEALKDLPDAPAD